MKKLITILILTILTCKTFAQNNLKQEVIWNPNPYKVSGNISINTPNFQGEYFFYDSDNKQIKFKKSFKSNSQENYKIQNVIFEPISANELGELDQNKIKKELNFKSTINKSRNDYYTTVEFFPIIKENNTFKKVKSFELIKTPESVINNTVNLSNVPTQMNSVLANGNWFKFYVEKSGVYKLSKSFIESLGFNLNGINPQKIKIYGNGGRMIPLSNAVDYPFDIAENAIQIVGEQDGKFDSQDYILFYAEGVDTYNQESDTHLNLYSNRSYYFITASGSQNGKRISELQEPNQAPNITVNQFDDYQFHEKDLTNFARLSRKWYGESFNIQNEQTFKFSFPNLVTSEPIQFKVINGLNNSNIGATFNFSINNNQVGQSIFNTPSYPNEDNLGRERSFTTTFNSNTDNIDVTITFNNNGIPTVIGYLDYIAITAKRTLRGINKQFHFTYNDAQNNIGIIEYQISNANTISQIWDVTDIYNVSSKSNTSNSSDISFKAQMGSKKKYIALDQRDYYTPLRETQNLRVSNQNLKAEIFRNNQGNFSDIDYLIITPANLRPQAEKLANLHRTKSGLTVKVINLENIYLEFGSGKQDIGAIKNLIRYAYYNASSEDKRIKYVNLFGDASFDFKNRIQNNTNIVPIYHYYNASSNGNAIYNALTYFCSDDYFGMMDQNEGTLLGSDKADVAVGRMLVTNNQNAELMVQKVLDYYDSKSFGRWRNNITLISDDIDKSADQNMQFKLNELADEIQLNKPFFNVNKIYTDAYIQETSSGGARYPQARQDIISAFENGSLVFNYLGHGGEEGLAHERIFEKVDGENLNNKYKYPVFVTVTCEFTKFDNPLHPTAGEYVYWNPSGGAVNMITTTRQIGISTAENFNLKLGEIMFSYGSFENQPYPSVGEALRLAKNTYGVHNTRMVACIGDPALDLAIAKPKIILTHINDIPVDEFTGSFEALSHVKLKGEVQNENGTRLSNYIGELAIQVFDKKINRTTNANDNFMVNGQPLKMDFKILGETIFRGNASVMGGVFEFGFVVPKDIRIPIDYGRISFFAKRSNPLEAQSGYSESIKIGGINQNAQQDNTPPTVKLFMNDTNFISGGITNNSPIFIAHLEDENGMNTAGGIGHDMIAILDGDETTPYILNDYYQTELDNYKKGTVNFPLRDLKPGLHTITFKAYDVYNNLVTSEIQFLVISDQNLQIEKVLNYPNPFVSYTEFWFNHNRPFEPLEVQVQVFTITGKVVWTKNQTIINEGFLSRDIIWDGRDDFGDKIGKGVYIYKLTVKSTLTGKKAEKHEKLVIL